MSFQFVFENGVNGVFNIYFSVPGVDQSRMMIMGKDGTLVVEKNIITLKRRGKSDEKEEVETERGYRHQFEDFYDCIATGKEPVSTFHEAYKDFKTIVSALESAKKWDMLSL